MDSFNLNNLSVFFLPLKSDTFIIFFFMSRNFTLSSLLLQKSLSESPLIAKNNIKLSILSSKFKYFSSNVLYSKNIDFLAKNTDFMHFTSTAIKISKEAIDQQIITHTIQTNDERFTIIQCRFKNILSDLGAILYSSNNEKGVLTVQATSFIYCVSNKQSGAIYFAGSLMTLRLNCFTECGSKSGIGSIIRSSTTYQTKISNNHFFKTYTNSDSISAIFCSSENTADVNGGNITGMGIKGSAMYLETVKASKFEIRDYIFENLDMNALTLRGNNEGTLSTILFHILTNPQCTVLSFQDNKAIMIPFCQFCNIQQKLLQISNSDATFTKCTFDSSIKTNLSQLHLDSCETSYTGTQTTVSIGFETDSCWASIQTHSPPSKNVSFLDIIKFMILAIIAAVMVILAIRFIRIKFTDSVEREVLERLNVFEGEENPQIKIMLMEAREGKEFARDEAMIREAFEEQEEKENAENEAANQSATEEAPKP